MLRRTFQRWVATLVGDDDADDLTLAVYEALVNATEHAFAALSKPGWIWLHASVGDGQIIITITDNGTWCFPDRSSSDRGRGLPLIHRLTSAAHVELGPRGTTVCLLHELSPQYTG